jgi:hypothetical protein
MGAAPSARTGLEDKSRSGCLLTFLTVPSLFCAPPFFEVVMEASGNRHEICPGQLVSLMWTGAATATSGGAGV